MANFQPLHESKDDIIITEMNNRNEVIQSNDKSIRLVLRSVLGENTEYFLKSSINSVNEFLNSVLFSNNFPPRLDKH
jgi:hypothetical protein